jgi:regulator of sirC expression with transglutaminase-like and TPR domain
MTDPRLWDTLEATEAGAFERLLASPCCPGPGDMLLAVAAEFRPVAAGRVSFRLDELARTLFDVAGARDPRAASYRLATLLTDELGFRTDDSSLDGLWVDAALERRAGHPLALAVITAEIGRRAGIEVGICSTPTGWYAGIGEPERLWLIDPVLDPGPTPAGPVRRHCGHEVGFAALTGIYARLLRDGDELGAHRAARLRGRLPVSRHA